MLRRASPIAALCALALIGVAPAHAATRLTFLYNASAAFVAAYVAQDQGFLAAHGIDLDFSLAQSGAVVPPALVAGSAQLGAPTATALLQADEQGLDLVVVAGTSVYPQPANSEGVLARTGSGLAGPRDLVGHPVGLPSLGGIFEVLMRKWVRASGADDRKVSWVEVQVRQMGDALKGGLVDAVATIEPFYGRIVAAKEGYDIGDFEAVVPAGTMPVFYVSTRAWARQNAAVVADFRAALGEALAYIADPAHVGAARASIAKYTKLPPAAAATLAIPSNLEVAVKPDALSFWIAVAREQGLIKGNPDPASLIAP